MDCILSAALEEVCARGPSGIPLPDLWPALLTSLSSVGLHLCDAVKSAVWARLLSNPALRFQFPDGTPLEPEDGSSKYVDEVDRSGVKIVAEEHLRDNFLGIYDLKGADGELSAEKKRVLERLALARTSGITQSELAKEFGIKGNNLFYIVRGLEYCKLLVRQSSILRTKESGIEGENEPKSNQAVATNLIHLYRYAKNPYLGSQQRVEISRPDIFGSPCNVDQNSFTENEAAGESVKVDVCIKDFLPAMKAICDKLEEANEKVLVVSDIKQALGYRMREGHRSWRNILNRLRDGGLVEEFPAKVNGKEKSCLRLLRSFHPEGFQQTPIMCGYDGSDSEHFLPHAMRGQITDQLVELPFENLIYDMIDAAGPKGMIITEIYERVRLNKKVLYSRIVDMCSRFGMNLLPEMHKRTRVYRVWTSKNYHIYSAKMFSKRAPDRSEVSIQPKEQNRHGQSSPSANELYSCANNNFSEVDGQTTLEAKGICTPDGDDNQVTLSDIEHQKLSHETPGTTDDMGTVVQSNASNEKLLSFPLAPLKLQNLDQENLGTSNDGEISGQMKLNAVSDEKRLPLSSAPAKLQTSQRYPCMASTMDAFIRERRIRERLKNEKFLLVAELKRWLEDQKDKTTMMDKRTLTRTLKKLQQEGFCKCAQVFIPVLSNCNQSRKTDVILDPSIELSKELLDEIHNKQRTFEIQIRGRGSARSLNNETVTELTDVKRLSGPSVVQPGKYGAMNANGYVSSKMIRAKLLHKYFWSYLRSIPAMDGGSNFMNDVHELECSSSTCQLFALDMAVKAMPLELFLQVVGSAKEFDNLVKNCRLRLRLSDLPSSEYKQIMDTHATGRLSNIIDILHRLKLLQLVPGGQQEDVNMLPRTVLTHAMELKPYIEEPLPRTLQSSSSSASNLRPKFRHDFFLVQQETVDAYWETLEYCYAAADPASAKHAFPGSAVPEVFHSRSWASIRVMTVEQRVELLRRLAHDEPEKKIPFKECVKIARELDLTLEQVLHASYDKRSSCLQNYSSRSKAKVKRNIGDVGNVEQNNLKRAKTLTDCSQEHAFTEDELGESNFRMTHNLSNGIEKMPAKCSFNSMTNENCDSHSGSCQDDGIFSSARGPEQDKENAGNCAFIRKCAFSRLKPMRRKRFSWTDKSDRQLIMQYARFRAIHGPGLNRVDWSSLSDLPALPGTCRRRMHILRSDENIKKAVAKVCHLLDERFSRHLRIKRGMHDDTRLWHNDPDRSEETVQNGESLSQNQPATPENSLVSNWMECSWDDFGDPDIKAAIEEVLRYKRMIKMEDAKRLGPMHEKEWADVPPTECTKMTSLEDTLSCHGVVTQNFAGRSRSSRSRSTSHHSHGRFLKPSGSRGISIKSQVFESLSVANAVELLKLVFLNTCATPEVQASLSSTLRLYSEHDVFAAFNYLKMKDYMVMGHGSRPFVLSQKFWHSASSSPFPIDSGKRAAKFSSWLDEQEKDLLDDGAILSPQIQCGESLYLFALVCCGELSITPCLPKGGIGEADDLNNSKSSLSMDDFCDVDERTLKRKCTKNMMAESDEGVKKHKSLPKADSDFCSRREKGFPGIKVLLNRTIISSAGLVQCSTNRGILNFSSACCPIDFSSIGDTLCIPTLGDSSNPCYKTDSNTQLEASSKENIFDIFTSYATQLSSILTGMDEGFTFTPEVFKSVLSAIYQAGERGLSMEEVSKAVFLHGLQMAKIVVSTLEAYRIVLKVNAYDCFRVVDYSYRSKYLINTLPDFHKDNNLSSYVKSLIVSHEASQHQSQKNPDEICDNQKNTRVDIHHGHRITILDLPENPGHLNTESQSSDVGHATSELHVLGNAECINENEVGAHKPTANCDPGASQPILPWVNGDGGINCIVYKGLLRRVLGIVMQNPGIMEDDIISRMDVLNPQSCRRLLELLVLDNHISTRMMHQTTAVAPPAILQSLLGSKFKTPEAVFEKHFFANPMSVTLL